MFYFATASRLIAIATLSGAAVLGSMVNGVAKASGDPSTLMGMLPQGFSPSNCQQATPEPPALEKVTCDQSTDSDGPTSALFALYGNLDDLATKFQSAGSKMTAASSCPGDQQSPGPWTYGSSGKTGGQVECGSISDSNTTLAVVMWTDNSKLRAAVVTGPNISTLYQWWKTKSG